MLDDDAVVSHVLMTADAVGGVWTYALELAKGLARAGVRTTLATMGAPLSPSQRAAAARVPHLRTFESRFALEWMDDPWEDVRAAGKWLLAVEEQERPDVVHLNGYAHASLDWRAPRLVVAHSCVLSWWRAVLGEEAPDRYAQYRREVRRGLREADAVVAPTAAMLRALGDHYGAPASGIVIPNGLDDGRRLPVEKEAFVLSAGRLWDEAKNLRALGEAAPRLSWPVYAAGSAAPPSGKRAPAEAFAALRALGWLEPAELRAWMARAGVYALPARYEPFGLSALEAGLAGCALVLGDIPSLREVWRDAALYVPPDDVDALVAAVERLASSAPLRSAMGDRARLRARCFSGGRMASRYLRLYRELAARRSGAAAGRSTFPPPREARGPSTVHPCA